MQRTILLITIMAAMLLGGCAVNPITGEKELMLVSTSQELQIGREYAPEVEKQMGNKIDNPDIQNYISAVGAKIVRASDTPDREFRFTALNHESVNAMALPDGTIFITRGMLKNMKSEAQLAGVLAHEVAHVSARHVSSAMSRQIGVDLLLSAIASKTEMGQTTQALANYGRQIVSLKYSRDDEREADIGGVKYMTKAGYDPKAIVEVMEILESQSSKGQIEFLSSHPLPAKRKYDLQTRVNNMRPSPGLVVGKSEYKANVLDNLK